MSAVTLDWKPISELPDWEHRPSRQFVHIEGWEAHSGPRWRRQIIGDAYIDRTPDGLMGYRRADIERLLRDGHMDAGEVSHWVPFIVTWPEGT